MLRETSECKVPLILRGEDSGWGMLLDLLAYLFCLAYTEMERTLLKAERHDSQSCALMRLKGSFIERANFFRERRTRAYSFATKEHKLEYRSALCKIRNPQVL